MWEQGELKRRFVIHESRIAVFQITDGGSVLLQNIPQQHDAYLDVFLLFTEPDTILKIQTRTASPAVAAAAVVSTEPVENGPSPEELRKSLIVKDAAIFKEPDENGKQVFTWEQGELKRRFVLHESHIADRKSTRL